MVGRRVRKWCLQKIQEDTTVASTTVYLPFDKLLTSYYKTDKALKVTCKSQKDTNGVTPEELRLSQNLFPTLLTMTPTQFSTS